ncbi:hypothetical protein ACHWQZ_G010263 [Mnemiopsis leidyi]
MSENKLPIDLMTGGCASPEVVEKKRKKKRRSLLNRLSLRSKNRENFVDINDYPEPVYSSEKAPLNSCFFRDGKRQIDFVLAYRLDCSGGQAETKRRVYEANLRERGLELEHESAEHSSDNNTYFVKVHCPFDVLCDGAEFMNLKMPFKEEVRDHSSWIDRLIPGCVRNSFASPLDPLPQVYTTTFDKNKLLKMEHYYVGGADPDTLFTSSQRIQIVSLFK